MANRHFAKIADVWKHLPLVEAISMERPRRYWESHAGSAAYEIVDNPELRYGALRFFASGAPPAEREVPRYLHHLRELNPAGTLETYPGSPLLAMVELGAESSYVFCERDPASAEDLAYWAARREVDAEIVTSDGMSALYERLMTSEDVHDLFVHIDPYDPWVSEPGSVCAVDLAAAVATRGAGLMYWYGYSQPVERAWAFDALTARTSGTSLWCGDVMVESAAGAVRDDGDLGDATTPGTGFGVVLANVAPAVLVVLASLGAALAASYADVPLPDGEPGRLDFLARSS